MCGNEYQTGQLGCFTPPPTSPLCLLAVRERFVGFLILGVALLMVFPFWRWGSIRRRKLIMSQYYSSASTPRPVNRLNNGQDTSPFSQDLIFESHHFPYNSPHGIFYFLVFSPSLPLPSSLSLSNSPVPPSLLSATLTSLRSCRLFVA